MPTRADWSLRLVPLLGLAVAALGCAATNRTLVTEGSSAPAVGESVAIGRSFEQHPGSIRRGFFAVRTRDEWRSVWPGEAPQVDFSQQMALVAFGGRRSGGHSLRIERIVRASGELVVEVVESAPAEGCAIAAKTSHPFHIVLVPRQTGTVRFEVRTEQRSGCLEPPQVRLDCRVDAPEAWRSLGPILYPSIGQTLICSARAEGVVEWDWKLLVRPEGSQAALELSVAGQEARLRADQDGGSLLGLRARAADGQAALLRIEARTDVPTYEARLEADEPEGAEGLRLALVRRGEPESRCEASAPAQPAWCSAEETSFGHSISVLATEAGLFDLHVAGLGEAEPSATVTVFLGERLLARVPVPSREGAWKDGVWAVGTLDTAGAAFVGTGASQVGARAQ
jgi:hypothetical protein